MEIVYEREAFLTFADSEHIDNRCALVLNFKLFGTEIFVPLLSLSVITIDASSSPQLCVATRH